jgi:hypothetical protein
MGKRKATSTGLKDFDIDTTDTLDTPRKPRGVVLREQRLKGKTGGGKVTKGEDEETPWAEVVREKLGNLISAPETKIEEPLVSGLREPASRPPDLAGQLLDFSDATFKILRDELNIILRGNLVKRGDHLARAQESAAQGGHTYMSSNDMHHHLTLLQNVVPRFVGIALLRHLNPHSSAAVERGEHPPSDKCDVPPRLCYDIQWE